MPHFVSAEKNFHYLIFGPENIEQGLVIDRSLLITKKKPANPALIYQSSKVKRHNTVAYGKEKDEYHMDSSFQFSSSISRFKQ